VAGSGIEVMDSGFRVMGSGFRPERGTSEPIGLQSFNPYMKLNGTVLNRGGIFKDNIPGIEDFRNLNIQAPNPKEISNSNIQ